MQIDRLFGIVYILLNQKSTTARQLAQQFGVSRRTILRDLNTLSIAGVPIATFAGKGGGVTILDGYKLDKMYVSNDERECILMGLQTLLPTRRMGKNTLTKMRALFGARDSDWMEVDFSSWLHPAIDSEKFEKLKNAVIERNVVQFVYVNRRGEVLERKANPLKLVFKNNSWYVYAWCHFKKDYRFFKLSRISDLMVLNDTFDKTAFYCSPVEKKMECPKWIDLTAVFSPSVAYRVYDEFDNTDIVQNEDGTLTVDTAFPDEKWTVGYFLSYGANVKIMAPIELRTKITSICRDIQRIYVKGDTL